MQKYLVAGWLPSKWWPQAANYYVVMKNIKPDPMGNWTHSAWFNRFGEDFPGLDFSFGQLVRYKPLGPEAEHRQVFAPQAVEGLFMGWQMGKGSKWEGVYLVIAMDVIRNAFEKGHAIKVKVKAVTQLIPVEGTAQFPLKKVLRRESVQPRKHSTGELHRF